MAEAARTRQPQRHLSHWLTVGVSLLLAACGTVAPRGRAPIAPPPPAAAKPAPMSALPEDRARHRVALLVPLSGPNAGVGQSLANASVLALVDTQDQSLRITTYDTAAGAAAAAGKAIADGNRLILGPLLAEDVRAVAPIAAAAGVPVLAFSNDATVAGDDVWLLGFQPAPSIERVVRYARSRGLTRFAALVPQGPYGRTASTTLIRAVEAAHGSVAAIQSYDRAIPGSVGTAVAALAKQRFDAVLIADSGRVAIASAPLLKKQGARLLGTELWNAEAGLKSVTVLQGAWYASVDDGMFDQLALRYRARYGKTPYRLASLGYDAVLLAVRIARDWRADAFPVDRLADHGGFAGVDGAFRFNDAHSAERALAVHQIGAPAAISPAPKEF